jgi:hypothetical protein
MLDMRFAHGRHSVLLDQIRNSQKPLPNVLRQRIQLSLHSPVEHFHAPCHQPILSQKRDKATEAQAAKHSETPPTIPPRGADGASANLALSQGAGPCLGYGGCAGEPAISQHREARLFPP